MKKIRRVCFAQSILHSLRFRSVFRSIRDALTRAGLGLYFRLAVTCWALSVLFLVSPGSSRADNTQLASISASTPGSAQPAAGVSTARVEAILDRLPRVFEPNVGQFETEVRFSLRANGYRLFLIPTGIAMVLHARDAKRGVTALVRLEYQNATEGSTFEGVDRLASITNYFGGDDPTKYVTDVPNYARVRQIGVFPGVDVIYQSSQGRFEHDFYVHPGADARRIKLKISGHEQLSLTDSGDLLIETAAGEATLKKPYAYQESDGKRTEVRSRYVVDGDNVGFDVDDYDRSRTLVIDPILTYSTLYGGNAGDAVYALAVDSSGNVYITGGTSSTDIPRINAVQSKLAGKIDGFVAKLNAGGSGLVYSTYLGGRNGLTNGRGIAVDSAGNAYIGGDTTSSAFPVTKGAYQTTKGSDPAGFVTKLGPVGNQLLYSTFVVGAPIAALALDSGGSVYVTGKAYPSFTRTPGAFQTSSPMSPNSYVAKLNATGNGMAYATYLGGSNLDEGRGIAIDAGGNAYVTGIAKSADFPLANPYQSARGGTQDAFVSKLNPAGAALVYSTYLGGTLPDSGFGIAVDSAGNAYVVGTTYSIDFPVLRPFQGTKAYTGSGHENINQAFLTKLDPSGSALVYSSYWGGDSCLGPGVYSCYPNGDDDAAVAVALDAAGNVYFSGYARSVEFPQWDRIQQNQSSSLYGPTLPFVAMVRDFGTGATPTYSVVLGIKLTSAYARGVGYGLAVDAGGNAYVGGLLDAYGFDLRLPVTPGALRVAPAASQYIVSESFVFKIGRGRFTTDLFASSSFPTSVTAVTFTAVVSSPVPGGTVTFSSNGTAMATVPLTSGQAVYATILAAGIHEITAAYSGDGKVSRPLHLPVSQALVCN